MIRWLMVCLCAVSWSCSKQDRTATESRPATSAEPPASTPEPSDAGPAAGSDTFATDAGPVAVQPIHHGTVAFDFAGTRVVVDPWSKAPADALGKADIVLVTDIHRDHFDPAAIATVSTEATVVVAPQAVAVDLPGARALANGETTELSGITIEAVPMYNLKRGPDPDSVFHEKGRGNGYVLGFGGKRFYVSGDTECTEEMRALSDIDVALICMNLPYTMPPDEAAECVRAFRPAVVIPYHYRGSDLEVFRSKLADLDEVEVRTRDFYSP